ncbi:MAG: acyl-CoA carboxylase subunit beta [Thermoplasmata archaeon]|nr:acyl-CoA carboxylase subunit beta [Thermoplasmata archaeon]MCI4359919.1 acyl-CoA carboxylase subunit beta [Thermoplasmata archaeon]
MSDPYEVWRERIARSREGGGAERNRKQAEAGKLGARARLEALFDPGSFTELGELVTHRATAFGVGERRIPGDGVVVGFGEVDGRRVAAFAQDATAFGGALGEAHAEKIVRVMQLAHRSGIPIVGLNDSGGARIQEGVMSLAGYGEVFFENVTLSGVVPQLSVILGACAGGAVYSPAITDFVIMRRGTGEMYITGPDVIRAVTGEQVSAEELGGADTHATKSGVSHFTADTDEEAIRLARRLLSYLPLNNLDDPPAAPPIEPSPSQGLQGLSNVVPVDANAPYDVHDVIDRVVDADSVLEVQASYAPNIVTEFARVNGEAVGVVANQPTHLAGCLDIAASSKAARFVRFLDAFNFPIVTFVDVPGFLPGTQEEHGGIIRHGAKLLYAYAEATVPKLTVILRKAYGGAYVVMCSKHLGGDLNYAWPTAEIAVMGAEGAVSILFRRELGKAEGAERGALQARLVGEYRSEFLNPYLAAERGYVDSVIDPAETRARLVEGLRTLRPKREDRPPRKHGNLPL